MQRLIGIFLLHLIFFSAIQGQSKISENLMTEINTTLESHQYIDAVIQLNKLVSINENHATGISRTDMEQTWLGDKQHSLSVMNLIESKSKQAILFSDGPDINGKIYLKATPAVFFELDSYQEVLAMDIAGGGPTSDPTIQSPAEIPFHLQPIQWETGIYQGSGSSSGTWLHQDASI